MDPPLCRSAVRRHNGARREQRPMKAEERTAMQPTLIHTAASFASFLLSEDSQSESISSAAWFGSNRYCDGASSVTQPYWHRADYGWHGGATARTGPRPRGRASHAT